MFDKARSSHIMIARGFMAHFYGDLIKELTYKDANANLFLLRQGINDKSKNFVNSFLSITFPRTKRLAKINTNTNDARR